MPRKGQSRAVEASPDPKYDSVLVTRFIIRDHQGRQAVHGGEASFYGAMTIIEEKSGQKGRDGGPQAGDEQREAGPRGDESRRVGGANYQVPVEVRPDRRNALATRWIITFARGRADHTFAEKFAAESSCSRSRNEGPSVKKREDTHKMAEANKAFAHYRW